LESAVRKADADEGNPGATLHQIAQTVCGADVRLTWVPALRQRTETVEHGIGLLERDANAAGEQARLLVDALAGHAQVAVLQRVLTQKRQHHPYDRDQRRQQREHAERAGNGGAQARGTRRADRKLRRSSAERTITDAHPSHAASAYTPTAA
jgi:hypothetical protein